MVIEISEFSGNISSHTNLKNKNSKPITKNF